MQPFTLLFLVIWSALLDTLFSNPIENIAVMFRRLLAPVPMLQFSILKIRRFAVVAIPAIAIAGAPTPAIMRPTNIPDVRSIAFKRSVAAPRIPGISGVFPLAVRFAAVRLLSAVDTAIFTAI